MKIVNNFGQGTPEWFNYKLGRITGTVLADILGTPKKREDTFAEIVGERLTPEVDMEHLHENAMARGSRLEPEARLAFEYVTGKKVEQVAFVEHDEHTYIGYSPDGIISETEDLEIKCPEAKNYMKIVLSNEVPKEYHWQIVQGFVTNPKLEIRWFCAYNPEIPSNPIVIIPCKRSDYADDIAKAFDAERKFIEEVEQKLKELQ
jgi:putative phage-type endonuclease